MATTVEYQGKVYQFPEKLMLAETAFCEGKLHAHVDEWFHAQTTMAMIYMAIKRVSPGLLSWEELGQKDIDELKVTREPETESGEAEVVDQEALPLDPTEGGGKTAPSSASNLTVGSPTALGVPDTSLPSSSTTA